jgi:aldehyde dehydrogenase (NAD+)
MATPNQALRRPAEAQTVSEEALALLARLGVPESAFATSGLPARSPITGEVIAHLK